jgi:hypothetical protein
VGLGRGRAHHQPLGDLGVGQPSGHKGQHLPLALGQAGQGGRGDPARLGPAGELGDQPPGHRRGEQGVAGRNHPDGGQQVGRGRVLEQEPAGPGPQRLVHVLVQVEGGQDQHPGLGQKLVGDDPAGRLQPVQTGHADVHQHHVRAGRTGQLHRFQPVPGLAHHLQVLGRVDQHPEPGPDQRLVVGHHDPYDRCRLGHGGPPNGRLAATRKPPPGRGPASRVPP